MKVIFIILGLSLLLVGCNEEVLKMKTGAYYVQCEGLERTVVIDPVITVGQILL